MVNGKYRCNGVGHYGRHHKNQWELESPGKTPPSSGKSSGHSGQAGGKGGKGRGKGKGKGKFRGKRVNAIYVLEDGTTVPVDNVDEIEYEEQYDDNEMPLVLRELDYGVKEFVNPLSLYHNQQLGNNVDASPIVFGQGAGIDSDMAELEMNGWEPLM